MDKKLLNLYVSQSGQWTNSEPYNLEFTNAVEIGGHDVQLWETAVGGTVLLLAENWPLTSFGNPEVFLTVAYTDGATEFLSAPLSTSFLLRNVAKITLSILFPVGLPFVPRVYYNALVNAHCIYGICDIPIKPEAAKDDQ